MQINAYNIDNLNKIFSGTSTKAAGVSSGEVKGFFGVSLEKTGQFTGINQDYTYGKNSDESMEMGKQEVPTNQKLAEFMNQNIEKLSELVTEEDYSQIAELGLAPDKEDPTTLVTVYERIQIQLATYGEGSDTSLNISAEKMEKVLGSKAMAEAVKMAEDVTELSDGAKKYLLKNELEPTIENVYRAVHSTSGNGTSAEAGMDGMTSSQGTSLRDEEWNSLKDNVSELLDQAGMDVSEENLSQAKWLLENKLPVTKDNIIKLNELESMNSESAQDVIKTNIAIALVLGMEGTDAYVTENWISAKEISETKEAIDSVTDDTIYDIVEAEKELNAANIKTYGESKNDNGTGAEKNRDFENQKFIQAKKVILEARMVLTSSSLMGMQKLGINITYTEISVMVAETEQQNNEFFGKFFSDSENTTLESTNAVSSLTEIMKSMSQIPSSVMGNVYREEIEFNISSISEESTMLQMKYTKAEITYEAVGTEVRRDLGDNIQKAFASLDGILSGEGIEVTEDNRRSARILAYNQMEITKESVEKMSKLMTELDDVRDNMTPKTAAYLVENNVDILHTDIRELNKKLENINEQITEDTDEENFAKYLWKLEKSGNISEENRARYIDIYRTLNMVGSQESSAIGAVSAQNAEMTLGNLLSAVKSRGKAGMDISVDKTFGFNTAEDRAMEVRYTKEAMDDYMDEIKKYSVSEETAITMLEGGHKVSIENIMSALEVTTPGSELRKYLLDKDKAKKILDRFNSREEAAEAFDELEESENEETAKMMSDTNGIDISYEKAKARIQIQKDIKFMANSARNESYHIPVDIDGESVNVRVSLVKSEGAGKVEISMNSQEYGMVKCDIISRSAKDSYNVNAMVYCENEELVIKMEASRELFAKNINLFMENVDFNMEVVKGSKIAEYHEQNSENAGVDNGYLYRIAKTFIKSVKETLENNPNNE